MALADAGAGAQAALYQLLEQRMLEAKFAEEQRQAREVESWRRAQLGENTRQFDAKLGEDTRQFDARLGFDQSGLDFEKTQWSDQAPARDANVGYIRTQTDYMNNEGSRALRDQGFELEQQKTAHGYRLGEIGESGRQSRLTDAAQAAATAQASAASPQGAYTAERTARTRASVQELMGKVGNWTAGMGSVLSNVPGTQARNFAAELDTLKANIAFNELAEMRQASKTGGALGAVSERELALLESTLGALDAGQSPENLRGQLQKVLTSLDRWEAAKGVQSANRPGGITIKSIRQVP